MSMQEEYKKLIGENDLPHFLLCGDGNSVYVIDNQFHEEDSDFNLLTENTFTDLDEVITLADDFAIIQKIKREPFQSRYCGFSELEYINNEILKKLMEVKQ